MLAVCNVHGKVLNRGGGGAFEVPRAHRSALLSRFDAHKLDISDEFQQVMEVWLGLSPKEVRPIPCSFRFCGHMLGRCGAFSTR